MSTNRITVFDLCGTIVHKNTTFDFITFMAKEKRNYFRYFLAKILSSFIGKALYIIARPFGFSLRDCFIYLLKGYSEDSIKIIAELYAKKTLLSSPNKHAIEQFHQIQSSGEYIQIASASIEPIVKAFCKLLKADSYVSTKLCFKRGVCTGKLDKEFDTKGRKESFIVNNGMRLNKVFTDNLDDFNLCFKFDYIFIYTKRKHKKKWDNVVALYLRSKSVNFLYLD